MKFVHAADVHLDSPLRGLERYDGAPVSEMRGATRRSFENVVDLCRDERADVLLLAGDLYDGDWRDFGTGLFFAAQMARLREAGVRVFVVRGNHDAASRITRNLRLPNNVHVFASRRPETVVDERLGLAVHGQSFGRADITDDLAAAYPPPRTGLLNIGLLHTSAGGRPGHENYAPCRVADLVARGYDYWALGHVHAREVLNQDPWVVFPGNLQGRHARETGPKGCTVVDVDDGSILGVEHHALDVVRWARIDLDAGGCGSPGDVLGRLEDGLRKALADAQGRVCAARVQVAGRCGAHAALVAGRESWIADARALATDVGAGMVWLEKVSFNTAPEIDWAELARGGGPLAELLGDIEALREDQTRCQQLATAFAELGAKLPAEIKEGNDSWRMDAAQVERLLSGVEALLLPRLLGTEVGR